MHQRKRKWLLIGGMLLVLLLSTLKLLPLSVTATKCEHQQTKVIVQKSECETSGYAQTVCANCNEVLMTNRFAPKGHDFGEYVTEKEPYRFKNGIKTKTCLSCGKEESIEFECPHIYSVRTNTIPQSCSSTGMDDVICLTCQRPLSHISLPLLPHDNFTTHITKEATCLSDGVLDTFCGNCGTFISSETIPALGHSWSYWNYTKTATPLKDGERTRSCLSCSASETEAYSISIPYNGIYIPSAGLNAAITHGPFEQWAVDSYDIVYCEGRWGGDPSDPIVLGHDYNSLGILYNTAIGDTIYLSVNGQIKAYTVHISESATPYPKDIIGNSSGLSVFHKYANETLHMYTCYGGQRWIVIAERIY